MSDVGGSLLRRAGLVNARDLDEARALQAAEGGLLVEWLIALGAVTEEDVAQFFHRHLLVPRVDKRLARLPRAVLATVPPDMAAIAPSVMSSFSPAASRIEATCMPAVSWV